MNRFLGPNLVEQLQFFLEQDFVVRQVQAKQRERLHERTPAEHYLSPAVGQRVHCGEALENPDRII